jgi:hypothetical protein
MPDHTPNPLRADLLAQEPATSPARAHYQQEVAKMLEKETQSLARERERMRFMWPFLVILCTAFLVIGGFAADSTTKLWFGILACFWFLFGSLILLRYLLNRNHVEHLRELKTLQLQIEDLTAKLNSR